MGARCFHEMPLVLREATYGCLLPVCSGLDGAGRKLQATGSLSSRASSMILKYVSVSKVSRYRYLIVLQCGKCKLLGTFAEITTPRLLTTSSRAERFPICLAASVVLHRSSVVVPVGAGVRLRGRAISIALENESKQGCVAHHCIVETISESWTVMVSYRRRLYGIGKGNSAHYIFLTLCCTYL